MTRPVFEPGVIKTKFSDSLR